MTCADCNVTICIYCLHLFHAVEDLFWTQGKYIITLPKKRGTPTKEELQTDNMQILKPSFKNNVI